MKNTLYSFTSACFMLTLGLCTILLAPGCADDEILLSERHGCTDPDAENFDRAASSDDGACIYTRDKFPGTYSIVSLEIKPDYDGYISLVKSILIARDPSEAGRVSIKFVDNFDLEFGSGVVEERSLTVQNIRTNADEDFIELQATQNDGLLAGQFVIRAVDQSAVHVCSFVAIKN